MIKHRILFIIIGIAIIAGITAAWLTGREKGFEEAFRLITDSSAVKITRYTYMRQLKNK